MVKIKCLCGNILTIEEIPIKERSIQVPTGLYKN